MLVRPGRAPARFSLLFTLPFLNDFHIDLVLLFLGDDFAVVPHAAAVRAEAALSLLFTLVDGQEFLLTHQ